MCLGRLLTTPREDAPSLPGTWHGPMCCAGFEIRPGDQVRVWKPRSSRLNIRRTASRTFIPCFECRGEVVLGTLPSWAGRGFESTDSRDLRVRARKLM